MNNNGLGVFIRSVRKNFSLRDFARKCGISHSYLDSIEKGKDPRTGKPVCITLETLKALSRGTGYTVQQLLELSGESLDNPLTDDPIPPGKEKASPDEVEKAQKIAVIDMIIESGFLPEDLNDGAVENFMAALQAFDKLRENKKQDFKKE